MIAERLLYFQNIESLYKKNKKNKKGTCFFIIAVGKFPPWR